MGSSSSTLSVQCNTTCQCHYILQCNTPQACGAALVLTDDIASPVATRQIQQLAAMATATGSEGVSTAASVPQYGGRHTNGKDGGGNATENTDSSSASGDVDNITEKSSRCRHYYGICAVDSRHAVPIRRLQTTSFKSDADFRAAITELDIGTEDDLFVTLKKGRGRVHNGTGDSDIPVPLTVLPLPASPAELEQQRPSQPPQPPQPQQAASVQAAVVAMSGVAVANVSFRCVCWQQWRTEVEERGAGRVGATAAAALPPHAMAAHDEAIAQRSLARWSSDWDSPPQANSTL